MGLGNKFFDELKKRCGLSEKHVLVIKSLRNGDLPAKKISARANIPLGRLYEYLNELLYYGLIEKKGKKPCAYSIENMGEKVRNFMKKRFDNVVSDEKVILDMLQKKEETERIEITSTKEEFIYTQLKMLSSCKKMYTLTRYGSIPFIVYPSRYEEFLKLRKEVAKVRPMLAYSSHEMSMMVNRAYIDAYKGGKSLTAIIAKKSFDFHLQLARKNLGEEFFVSMVKDLLERIKKYNIKIYLLNEHFPMQIFINEDTAYLSMIHEGGTYGTVIYSKNVREIYMHMYEEMIQRSQPAEKYLKEVLKQ